MTHGSVRSLTFKIKSLRVIKHPRPRPRRRKSEPSPDRPDSPDRNEGPVSSALRVCRNVLWKHCVGTLMQMMSAGEQCAPAESHEGQPEAFKSNGRCQKALQRFQAIENMRLPSESDY